MMVTNSCERDNRVLREAKTLSNNGYDVVILALSEKKKIEKKEIMGITIKYEQRNYPVNSILGKIDFFKNFVKVAIEENADVYHAHDLSTLLECYIASNVNNSKLVYDSHELVVIGKKIKRIGNIYSQVIENLFINQADAVITVNEFIANILEKEYSLENTPTILMNLPDTRYYGNKNKLKTQKETIRLDKEKTVLFVGNLSKDRGLFDLIKSMDYLNESYKLLMIGDGDIRNELEKYAKKNQLVNQISFLDFIDYQGLIDKVKLADAGIYCNYRTNLSYYYSTPNKLFEYLVAGLPIIAPNYPFYRKFLKDNRIGLLLEEISPDEIAKKIKKMFENEQLYEEFKNNVLKIRGKWVWENEEKKLIELYGKLLSDMDE